LLVALYPASALIAQEAPKKKSVPIRPAASAAKPARLNLTPEQQRGLRLLAIAQSEARGLQPDMHAFVLWQASHGYRKIDPAKADALLKDAFRVTLSVDKVQERCTASEAEMCGAKHWLQKQILQDLIAQSKRISPVQHLLTSAEPEVQRMVNTNLFRRYVREKAFDRARNLLNRMADENGYFSYGCAAELMDALPQRSQDRLEIFSEALQAYGQHADEKYPTFEDPAIMVLRFWKEMPPSLVLGAVDQIFDRAKVADEGEQNIRVGISANKGDAYFSSVYQFRLYQLMPVLEQLDPSRAGSLLREKKEVQSALERYPQSMASMNALPPRNTQSGTHRMPGILSIGTVDTAQAAADEPQREISRRQSRILSEAEKGLKQALSDAMGLPSSSGSEADYSPRASTLISLARIAITRNPAVSRVALTEIRKIADNMSLRSQAGILAELPEIYLRLGDEDEAQDILNALVKIAGNLYSHDSDANDANQAFKGMWPSANLWRHCVAVATRLAPTLADQIIQDIPDPEIRTFERITFANSLLGASTPPLSVIEKHKTGVTASIGL